MQDDEMRELRAKLEFSDELMNDVFDAYECNSYGRDDVRVRDYTRRLFLKFCCTKSRFRIYFKSVWENVCKFATRLFGHIGNVFLHTFFFVQEIVLSFRIFTRPLMKLVRLCRVYRKHKKEIEILMPIVEQILELEKGKK